VAASTPSDTAATAILRWRKGRRLDFGAFGISIVSLDPDYREDNDRCRVPGTAAEADNATFIRKFNDRAHQPLSPSPAEA
jgi:hypothetical protein